jgi:putative hef-like homing endonuclease
MQARRKHSKMMWDNRTDDEKRNIMRRASETFRNRSEEEKSETQKKRQATNLQRYGTLHPCQSQEIKDKIKQTNIERYGVENYSKTPEFLRRIEQTNIAKYGTPHRLQNQTELQKHKATMLEKYGAEYAMQSEELNHKNQVSKWSSVIDTSDCKTYEDVKRKYIKSLGIKYEGSVDNISIGSPEYPRSKAVLEMFLGLAEPNIDIVKRDISNYHWYARSLGLEIAPAKVSDQEKELGEFVSSLCECEFNNRTVITPKELDIWIPSKNIAIEYNGEYWHDSDRVGKTYHKDKTVSCEEKGVQLLHIWAYDWNNKQDIMKSIIRSKLGKSDVLYARKCQVKIVDNNDVRDFFNNTHLKGHRNASITFALMFDDEIVMAMSFSRHREYEWELTRMASKLNTTVVGGMSKLLAAFRKHTNAKSVMSYVDRDISNGKSYYACGFELLKTTEPSYWYVGEEIIPRQSLDKQSRLKAGFAGSEDEYAKHLGLKRIDNSGNLKMIKYF